MHRLLSRVVRRFARLTKQDVQQSSYDELVEKMARTYGKQEYRTRSALSLMEMHHLYGVFGEGQRVLDIGTGTGGWAALAIKHNRSTERNPLVVCVDKIKLEPLPGAKVVKGDFTEQETKVDIVEALGKGNLFNTMFVDIEPQYTSVTEIDAPKINLVIVDAMDFGMRFMKAGGTLVCKTLLSSQTPELELSFRTYFSQMHRHRPSHSRTHSPMRYYVLKGFMMTEASMLITRFREEINSSPNKLKVLRKYRKHRSELFDPDRLISDQVENTVYEMLDSGQTQEQVIAAHKHMDFVNARIFVDKYKKMQQLSEGPADAKMEFMKQEYGQNFGFPIDLPATKEDKLKLMEQAHKEIEEEEKEGQRENPDQKLLEKDEHYLKHATMQEEEVEDYYDYEDLNEEVVDESKLVTPRELEKMKALLPGFDKIVGKMETGTLTDEDIKDFESGKFGAEYSDPIVRRAKPRFTAEELREALNRQEQQEDMDKEQYELYKDLFMSREKKERRRRGSGRPKPLRKPSADSDDFDSD